MSKLHNVTFAELLDRVAVHGDWGVPKNKRAALRFLALAACGEAGELANKLKKDWRGDKGTRLEDDGVQAKVDEEIVDLANYTVMLAHRRGINLLPAMFAKLLEVEARPAYKSFLRKRAVKNAMRHVDESRKRVKAWRGL